MELERAGFDLGCLYFRLIVAEAYLAERSDCSIVECGLR